MNRDNLDNIISEEGLNEEEERTVPREFGLRNRLNPKQFPTTKPDSTMTSNVERSNLGGSGGITM